MAKSETPVPRSWQNRIPSDHGIEFATNHNMYTYDHGTQLRNVRLLITRRRATSMKKEA